MYACEVKGCSRVAYEYVLPSGVRMYRCPSHEPESVPAGTLQFVPARYKQSVPEFTNSFAYTTLAVVVTISFLIGLVAGTILSEVPLW